MATKHDRSHQSTKVYFGANGGSNFEKQLALIFMSCKNFPAQRELSEALRVTQSFHARSERRATCAEIVSRSDGWAPEINMECENKAIRAVNDRRIIALSACIWSLALLILGQFASVHAQNRRLETTAGGDPLQTESLRLVVPAVTLPQVLSFDFSFATDERPAPGAFLDSLTFSVQMIEQRKLALLLTIDGSGLKLAPNTPGAVVFNLEALKAASVAYFGALSDPNQRAAYHVDFSLPGELGNGAMELSMDLFNNGDAQKSVGTLANVIIVPEPRVILLAAAGAVLLIARKAG